jgi:lysophospholipase L1-like esterase
MARLPTPGSDDGTWGNILNDFLTQVHNPDGSLKPGSVSTASLGNGSVTTSSLADSAVTKVKLDPATQSTLSEVTSKYTKPPSGIPAADLTNAAQTNLTKAGTAVQSVNNKTPDGWGAVTLSASDVGAPTTLAGDQDVSVSNPATGQALIYDTTSSKWKNQALPSGPVTSVAGKTGAVTLAESDISNLTADMAAKTPTIRLISAGVGLTGGGDLSADRSLAVTYGASAGTAAQGNDSRITGAAQIANNLSDVASPSTALANLGGASIAVLTATNTNLAVLTLTATAVKTSSYAAAPQDLVLCDATTVGFTVTLPTAPADKTMVEVKKTDATLNIVTVAVGGSETFLSGGTTASLAVQGHAIQLRYQASTSKWITVTSDTPLAQLDLRYQNGAAALSPRPIHGVYQVLQQASNGTDTGVNTMVRRTLPAGIGLEGLRLRFTNSGCGSNGDLDGANSITVVSSIGLSPTGPWFPVRRNGSRTMVLEAGADVESDPLWVHVMPGGVYYEKTFLSVTSAQTWYAVTQPGAAGTDYWCSQSSSETDLSQSTAAFTTTTGTRPFSATTILAEQAPANRASVAIVGDSISGGVVDNSSLYSGFVLRALNGQLPYTRIAVSGSKVQNIIDPAVGRRRLTLIRGCNVANVMYGTNDIFTALRTQAQVQADLLTLWTILTNMGMRIFANTFTPQTTSTDSWTTAGNQTVKTGETVRVAINDWIRAGAPIDPITKTAVVVGTAGALLTGQTGHPLFSYFETADIAETGRNSGLWKVTGTANYATADGTHPTTAMYTLLSAAIVPATLRVAAAAPPS